MEPSSLTPRYKEVKLWDVASRTNIATLEVPGASFVNSVAFSPDGTILAYTEFTKIKLWDVAGRTNIATLEGHTGEIKAVAFSSDGTTLASGAADEKVKLWDVATRQNVAILVGHEYEANSVVFSPDGTTLASGGRRKILLWDVATRTNIATLEETGIAYTMSFSPDGTMLAFAGATLGSRVITLWDVATHQNIGTLVGHESDRVIRSVVFSPDGTTLASGSYDRKVKLWDVATLTNIATLEGHTNGVNSVAFSSDGTVLASASQDETVKLWDTSEWAGTPVISAPAGICDRTEEVQTAILGAISGVSDCVLVTDTHLAAISGGFEVIVGSSLKAGDFDGLTGVTALGLDARQSITLPAGVFDGLINLTDLVLDPLEVSTLPAGAFDGLTNLTTLALSSRQLSTLPAGVFDNLTNLTGLVLSATQLSTLPAGVFDALTNLTYLELYAGQLSTLPDGIFDQLTKLTTLKLSGTQLTSLPDGIFDQLTALTELDLNNNQLTTLPDGLFSGLSSLTQLRLQGNAVDPLPLTVSLEKVGNDQFKAVAPTGAPFDIVLPLSVTNGTITDGATTITIPKGSVESETLTVSGTTFAVTIDMGTLPGLPTDVDRQGVPLHRGYTLVKSDDLPLVFTNLGGAVFTPVCDRTPQVRDKIVEQSPVSACGDVTEAHLAAIEGLLLGQITIVETIGEETTGLKAGDFDGLTGLTTLWVAGEQLSSIPAGVFDELISLETLTLGGSFSSLPDGIFDGLTGLTTLILGGEQLSSLPDGVFDELISLETLILGGSFSSLPDGIFDGLTALTTLTLGGSQLSSLPDGFFDGLTALTDLTLTGSFSSLPDGVFDGLTALTDLNLAENQFTTLPAGLFDGLTALTDLYLTSNELATLPAGIFDELTALRHLYLTSNELTTLPADIFYELTALTTLRLAYNQLSSLPDGIFHGLTAPLTDLRLNGNTVDPLPLTVSLEKVADGEFKAVVPAGAPFDIALRIRDSNQGFGELTTIPAGSIESEVLTVSRPPGATYAVSVWIGPQLPSLPANHSGYELVNSTSRDHWLEIFEDISEQVWSGTITVGSWGNAFGNGNATGFGYSRRDNAGSISNATFTYRGTTYTINGFGFAKIGNNPAHEYVLTISPGFPACDKKLLRFGGLQLADALDGSAYGSHTYYWQGRWAVWAPIGQQWSYSITLHPTAPDAPIVTVINEGNQVMLSWTTPCDGGIDITGLEYREKVGNGSFGPWTPIPNSAAGEVNATSYTVTTLNNPSEYTFEVRAVNTLGEGEISAEALVSNPPAVPLSERTPQVRDGIVAAVPGISDHLSVTEAHLAAITQLRLGYQNITALKSGDFSGLTALTQLRLPGNQLSSLPDGIFEGLTSLTQLRLGGNSVDPLLLTVSLEKVGNDQFKAVAPTGAPFDMVLPVTVASGSISGGATTLTIPAGSVESEPLTVTRTPSTTFAVTVDIGTLPGLPNGHYGYALVKSDELPLEMFSRLAGGITPVCDRTPQVQTAILGVLQLQNPSPSTCEEVTEAHLATGVTSLFLNGQGITALKAGDFDGLISLEELLLYSNQLTTLPEGIFDGLSSLTTLRFGLNQLTTLPEGIFEELTALADLRMVGNQFTMLPEGIFEGLTALTTLRLGGNAVDPLPLTISLEKVGGDQFKVVAPTGAPFEIVLPLSVTNGTIDGGATTITISSGSIESTPLTVTRTPGTTSAVTVDIGTLPGLPSDHSGYTLVKSADLPLAIIDPLAGAPTPVCDRTPQVRDEIVRVVQGVSTCGDVTEAHLAAITGLYPQKNEITSLKVGDFDGLSSLTELSLRGNQLSSLPEDVFSGLSALTRLDLDDNQLSSLPEDVFSGLSSLSLLNLYDNQLSSLPAGLFSGLSSLTSLGLADNQLSSLPEDVFSGLSSLSWLDLRNNQLSSLPARVFSGLSSLTSLWLFDNQLSSLPEDVFSGLSSLELLGLQNNQLSSLPARVFSGLSSLELLRLQGNSSLLPLTVSLERVGETQFKATVHTGAPFTIVLPLSVSNGSIDGGATTITIPIGSVESEPLTVSRTPSTTFAVTVDIGTLPGLPTNQDNDGHFHQGYALAKSDDLPIVFTELGGAVFTPVCDRTPQVRDAIVAAVSGVNNCRNVTGVHLAAITELRLESKNITALKTGDFDGLSSLTGLLLRRLTPLTTLPEGVFSGLSSLSWLNLESNQLTTLPEGVFSGLSSLTSLNLRSNQLTTLPEGVFSGLSSLEGLWLNGNPLTTLPEGVFSGLSSLEVLALLDNQLTTLPEGVFSGLSSLSTHTLALSSNAVDPLPLMVSLEKVGADQVKAVAPSGAPFDMVLPLTVTNGSISGGATTLTIPAGSLESQPLTVTRTPGTTAAVTVDIGTLPGLPANHSGYTLVKSADLPLEMFSLLAGGICDRTPQVQTAILGVLQLQNPSPSTCGEVTETHLATGITSLFLNGQSITALQAGDFAGLTSLTELRLYDNQLTTLPADLFDGLTALTTLYLQGNQLSTLPEGLFDGLSSLTTLYLYGNSVDPLPLTVSLEKVGADQVKAVAPVSAPFDMVLPLTVANGDISGGATTITIPAGGVESQLLTVTRTPGTTAAVTMDIGTLPRPPTNHSGYALVKSADLPLEIIGATTPNTGQQAEATVNIPDANLRAKIETALGKTSGDPISEAEMATLTSLSAQDASISDLTGLETATNLTELQLWDNNISDISAVAGLTKLTKLYLWGNAITDISHVAALTNLTDLRLGENSIANVSAVAALTNLTHLGLRENSVSDLSAVAGLTNLTELRIGDNTISSIAAVANLTNLVWLDAPNNSISDIAAVANLTSLTSLTISGNSITDLSAVAGLTNLLELYLAENSVSDLSPLVANTGLGANTEIDVQGNPLGYPSIYTHIPALRARSVFIDFDNRTPTTLVKVSGDSQQGTPSTALAQPFVVEVQDANSVAFAGVPVVFAVTAGGGTLSATNTATDANGQAASTLTLGSSAGTNTVQVSVQGITQSETFTAEATTTNTAPVFTDGESTTRTVAENTEAGVNIGTAIAATDANNDALTYTLSGTDAAAFDIESTTGQLQTKAALDYETKTSYTVSVSVSDGSLTDTITVTITVTDIDESPTVGTVGDSGDQQPEQPQQPEGLVLTARFEKLPTSHDGSSFTFELHFSEEFEISFANVRDDVLDVTGGEVTGARRLEAGSNLGWQITIEPESDAAVSIVLPPPTDCEAAGAVCTDDGQTLSNRLTATVSGPAILTGGICDRTPQVQTAILAAVPGISTCDEVTQAHLKAITSLDLNDKSITSLQADDFSGLSSLEALYLGDNQLTSLPEKLFAGLSSLKDLYLHTNRLTSLPEKLFAGLSSLAQINLHTNRLTSLPEKLFAGLPSLTQLFLRNNRLTSLSADVFSNLSSLQYLYLDDNQLTSLPAEVFSGPSSLTQLLLNNNKLTSLPAGVFRGLSTPTTLWLHENTVDPLLLTVSLEKVGEGQFKAIVPTGAPFDIVLPLLVTDGQITGGVNSITVPAGSVESEPLTVTRTPGTTSTGTVDISTLPGLPTNHIGYALVKSPDLPLEVISAPTDGTVCRAGDMLAPRESCTYPGTEATFSVLDDGKAQLDIPGAPAWFNNVSIGGSLRISATINDEKYLFVAKELASGSWEIKEVGDSGDQQPEQPEEPGNEEGTPTLSISTASPLTEATLHESVVTLTLSGGTYERSIFDIRDAVIVSGIPGVTVGTFGVRRVSDTEVTVELEFDGTDFDTDATLTYSVGADAIANYNGPLLTAQIPVTANTEVADDTRVTTPVPEDSGDQAPDPPEQPDEPIGEGGTPILSISTTSPLTEAMLHESIVTLTLSGGVYDSNWNYVSRSVTVSGIAGVTFRRHNVDRVSDTVVTVELEFEGDIDSDATLTFTVGADAIANYNGPPFTVQIPVTANTESVVASTTSPLTEAMLHESVVTLTLSGGVYDSNWNYVSRSVTVSGVAGVTFRRYNVARVSDTVVTVKLEFEGDIDSDATLTFTVGADAIANYNGPPFTVQIPVTANTESVVASTTSPLTEATLHESVVTLTLSGRAYDSFWTHVSRSVTVSGITGVTFRRHNVDRVSDTVVTVELEFNGTDFDTDATLTFTVGADAIANYNGPALTTQIPVTAIRENALVANFPNPFNPETWISYQLAEPAEVTLTIYAVNGQVVRRLVLGHQSAGTYTAYWDGRHEFGKPIASGVYFYRLTAGDFTATRKMLIQK